MRAYLKLRRRARVEITHAEALHCRAPRPHLGRTSAAPRPHFGLPRGGRPDTVKQIVTTLTDPDSSDLLEPVGGGAAAEVVQEAAADGDMAPDPDDSRSRDLLGTF